jgi:hypothetical protein
MNRDHDADARLAARIAGLAPDQTPRRQAEAQWFAQTPQGHRTCPVCRTDYPERTERCPVCCPVCCGRRELSAAAGLYLPTIVCSKCEGTGRR